MLQEKIATVLERYTYKDASIIVGVSGGVDSVVLLNLLFKIGYTNIIVAHINHSLRDEAVDDASFVKKTALEMNYRYEEKIVDLKKIAFHTKDSLENSGRKIRYAFFEELRIASKGSLILTAHHADDLLESKMMHLLRGSGLRGLEGIKLYDEKRYLLRPLLHIKKEELKEFALANALTWKEDQTNTDTSFLRNKIRHDVIPLCQSINPAVDSVFDRLSQQALEIEDFLYQELLSRIGSLEDEQYVFKNLTELPAVLLKEFIVRKIRNNDAEFIITTAHIENVFTQFLRMTSGHTISFSPALECARSFETVYISPYRAIDPLVEDTVLDFNIFPDSFSFGEINCSISAAPTELQILKESAEAGILVRFPKEGDRVLLSHGEKQFHKPLKKYFIEKKIPVELRHKIPVLISHKTGEVIALLGQQSLVVTTQPSIYLKCEHAHR
ncbi:MAG: tRNA lysidine(34) synthetase TilS [Candidatus Gracilibacteria bacterium]